MSNQATTEHLTLQQAADVLNVSEEWIGKLLERGTLEAVEVDGEERLRSADVLAYKAERDARRAEALDDFVRLSEELGLYDIDDSEHPFERNRARLTRELSELRTPDDAERLRRTMTWSRREMAAFLGLTPGAYAYRLRKGALRPVESEKLAMLELLLAEATRVLDGEDGSVHWLKSPILSLEGRRPVDLLVSFDGFERVRNKLLQIEYGTF